MPKPRQAEEQSAADTRMAAINQIAKGRLDRKDGDTGESLRDAMEAQGVEMVDYDQTYHTERDDSASDFTSDGVKKTVYEDKQDTEQEQQTNASGAQDTSTEDADDDTAQDADTDARSAADDTEDTEDTDDDVTSERDDIYKRDGVWYTKVRVDGEDQEIPFDSLKKSAQKERAADRRFQEAAKMRQDAERTLQRANELASQRQSDDTDDTRQNEQRGPSQEASRRVTDEELRQEVQEIVQSISYGEDDDAVEKLTQLLRRAGQTPTTGVDLGRAEELVNKAIDQRVEDDRRTRELAAQDRWDVEYEDIAGDEELRQVAAQRAQYLMGRDPSRDIYEVFAEAGEFARKFRDTVDAELQAGDTTSQSEQTTEKSAKTDDVADREARKRTTAKPVRPASRQATREVALQGRPSPSTIIDSMREHRGQNF